MTVSSENYKSGPYTGDGVNTDFEFDFRILAAGDVRVVLTDTDGVDSDVDPTDYDVTFDSIEGEVSLDTAPAVGEKITILRNMTFTQPAAISNNSDFYPATHEEVFDRLTMQIQQVKEVADRGFAISPSSTDDPADILADIFTARDEAQAASTSASGFNTAAEGHADDANDSAIAAAQSETNIEALLASAMFRDVIFLTSASSPYTVTQAQNGAMLSIDTTGGAVTVNLPLISGLTLPFVLGVKKTSADGNAVTINRSGSDTIDGGSTKSLGSANSGTTLIPDLDTTPDGWTSADFGATAGSITVDAFTGTGAQTAFTLSVAPGSKNNTIAIVGGVPQLKSSYSLSGTTLTFNAAPANLAAIEVWSGTTVSIGTPADGTVTTVKLGGDITTAGKNLLDDADASAQRTTLSAAARSQTDFISGMIKTPAAQDYRIIVKAPIAGTITETVTRSASGTCTATFKVNTTALGGTANSVSSSEQAQSHASSNTFAVDDDIVITISSVSSCADMSFTIKYTRTFA
jgi:hypothetical protein